MNNKRIRILRGTAANINTHKNEVLEAGQPLYNLTTGELKVGNGTSAIKDVNNIVASGLKNINDSTVGITAGVNKVEVHENLTSPEKKDIGTSAEKWNNAYAEKFIGDVEASNVKTAIADIGKWEITVEGTSLVFTYKG